MPLFFHVAAKVGRGCNKKVKRRVKKKKIKKIKENARGHEPDGEFSLKNCTKYKKRPHEMAKRESGNAVNASPQLPHL